VRLRRQAHPLTGHGGRGRRGRAARARLGDASIHDAIQVIAYFNYVNRIAEAIGIGPEPEWAAEGSEQ
jgi:hypothetical protein